MTDTFDNKAYIVSLIERDIQRQERYIQTYYKRIDKMTRQIDLIRKHNPSIDA
tara:strand:- start:1017 stop:1175 length:159 start_codon:yes stop_codon:yes gene_type:complete